MPEPALPWRPEFLDALRMLARVSDGMAARGLPRPVLVGGGAVEFYTGSAVMIMSSTDRRTSSGSPGTAWVREMLAQSRELYALPIELNRDDLHRRIREETFGDYGVEGLET